MMPDGVKKHLVKYRAKLTAAPTPNSSSNARTNKRKVVSPIKSIFVLCGSAGVPFSWSPGGGRHISEPEPFY
jgi:hypothetical protein